MGLIPTVVGGVIGAVVGVGLHLLVETTTGFEASWFAIIIGALTGLGVHQANKSLAGRVSYLRGAVSAAIALAAIVGSPLVISKIVANDSSAPIGARQKVTGDQTGEDVAGDATAGTGGAVADTEAERHGVRGTTLVGGGDAVTARPGDFSVWQFVFMAVGTFIAYEFGRGTAKASPAPSAETMVMTDPSN